MKVKICCISSVEEAELAVELGADALGLVSEMPSGPGVISEELIAQIAEAVPPEVATFLLTSRQKVDAIIEQHQRCNTTTIQLVDALPEGAHQQLKAALPSVNIVQVIHVTGEDSLQEAVDIGPFVDAILLDSGNPNLETKQLGGTGRTHNWQISRKIVHAVDTPVFLAGGLNPQNVREAIRNVTPYGVDVCSGLRTDGTLDRSKAARFFKEINTIVNR